MFHATSLATVTSGVDSLPRPEVAPALGGKWCGPVRLPITHLSALLTLSLRIGPRQTLRGYAVLSAATEHIILAVDGRTMARCVLGTLKLTPSSRYPVTFRGYLDGNDLRITLAGSGLPSQLVRLSR